MVRTTRSTVWCSIATISGTDRRSRQLDMTVAVAVTGRAQRRADLEPFV